MENLRTRPWVTCFPTGSQHQSCWAGIHSAFSLLLISPAHSPRMNSFCRAWEQRNSSLFCYSAPLSSLLVLQLQSDTFFSEAPARHAVTEKQKRLRCLLLSVRKVQCYLAFLSLGIVCYSLVNVSQWQRTRKGKPTYCCDLCCPGEYHSMPCISNGMSMGRFGCGRR